jgi:3-phosphoshikimate 1-carboxyvinyltransferase
VLKKMGASIQIKNKRFFGNEPVADLNIKYSRLRGINVRGRIIPNIIDEIPVLTVAAALASGRTVISEARELRVKETDRIRSMASQLGKMGAVIKEKEDGLIIEGIKELKGAKVNSFGDHRTAMSLAIAGMLADGSTTINDTSCINTSFPGFLSLLNKLTKGDRA